MNAEAPGPTWTLLIPARFDAAATVKHGATAPMGAAGRPDEVAPCSAFLASEADSSSMTGQTLQPNGGTVVDG